MLEGIDFYAEMKAAEARAEKAEAENAKLREALRRIARGEYDNAHDCKAAATVAAHALDFDF